MKTYKIFFIAAIALIPGVSGAATSCSRANLTRCLDSVCAINVSSNPAARCQYCGTASAGAPDSGGMRSVAVGASAKYNISDKELKKAPDEPSERYAWAAKQCIKKVTGCTTDDVADVYDSLIEQSCKAAGIAADMKTLAADLTKERSMSSCSADVSACIVLENGCDINFVNCESDADFDKFFSACGVQATGCDEHLSDIRNDLIAMRDNAFKNAENIVKNIVVAYQNARVNLFNSAKNQCKDNAGRDACIETVCASNMINKCAAGFESERALAMQMCKFYDIACNALK